MKLLALALAGVLVLSGCSTASVEGRKAASNRLPDVTLQPLGHGRPVGLAHLRGPMVINLWASWCTPCRKELPHYQAFARAYAGKVDVLGIDYQDTNTAAARQLVRSTGVRYPLVTDPDGSVHAVGLPKLILLDGSGQVVHQEYVEITSVAQLEKLVRDHLHVAAP